MHPGPLLRPDFKKIGRPPATLPYIEYGGAFGTCGGTPPVHLLRVLYRVLKYPLLVPFRTPNKKIFGPDPGLSPKKFFLTTVRHPYYYYVACTHEYLVAVAVGQHALQLLFSSTRVYSTCTRRERVQ